MEIKEQIKKIEGDLCDMKMLYTVMLDAFRYFESENGQGTPIIYLCELIDDRFKNILNQIDEML